LSIIKVILILIFVVGCASKPNNMGLVEVKKLLKQNKVLEAEKLLSTDKELNEKKNKLLLVLNQGSLFHFKKDYLNASVKFQDALELIQKLYTKKISKKLKTLITNERADIYYGEKFEHSMVYYYLSIEYYLLLQQFENKNNIKANEYKNKLRATLRGWDVFLNKLRIDRAGETIFKRDMNQHLVGAALHQALGSREDLQIAIVLYENAFNVLRKSYNSYPSFNEKWKEYISKYSKLRKLSKKEFRKYVVMTKAQSNLKKYIKHRLLILAKKIGNKRFRSISKKIKATKSDILYAKKHYKDKTVFIIKEKSFIPNKIADKHVFGVNEVLRDPNASGTAKAVAAVGGVVLGLYASNILGMGGTRNQFGYYDPVRARAGYEVAKISTNEISLGFELPSIKLSTNKTQDSFKYKIGEQQFLKTFNLINPIDEIALEAINEHSSSLYKKLIFRLTTKHLTAILASYTIYKSIKKKSGDFFAKTAALLQYMAASKVIKNSEVADLRSWGTLPGNIQISNIDFKNNETKFEYSFDGSDYNSLSLGNHNSVVLYNKSL